MSDRERERAYYPDVLPGDHVYVDNPKIPGSKLCGNVIRLCYGTEGYYSVIVRTHFGGEIDIRPWNKVYRVTDYPHPTPPFWERFWMRLKGVW